MPEDAIRLSWGEALDLARGACIAAGASDDMARSLAEATVSAEACGRSSVGFAHLPDYVAALKAGRIDGKAVPALSHPAPCLVACDVRGGVAQLGFDMAFETVTERAGAYGLALLAVSGSFTTGELGWYVRRLADAGLAALAATNGPALMKPPGAALPVYCTNPIALGVPGRHGAAIVVDQASSATAFVNVRRAAAAGEAIPAGWAVDRDGHSTTDAKAALEGTLLTFGGRRGANIALIVEMLAAGLTGANWSVDAPHFSEGAASPGIGLLVVAISPALLDPGFAERIEAHAARLAAAGIHVPGRGQAMAEAAARDGGLLLPRGVVTALGGAGG